MTSITDIIFIGGFVLFFLYLMIFSWGLFKRGEKYFEYSQSGSFTVEGRKVSQFQIVRTTDGLVLLTQLKNGQYHRAIGMGFPTKEQAEQIYDWLVNAQQLDFTFQYAHLTIKVYPLEQERFFYVGASKSEQLMAKLRESAMALDHLLIYGNFDFAQDSVVPQVNMTVQDFILSFVQARADECKPKDRVYCMVKWGKPYCFAGCKADEQACCRRGICFCQKM